MRADRQGGPHYVESVPQDPRLKAIAAAAGSKRIVKRSRSKDPDPSRRLANLFADEWAKVMEENFDLHGSTRTWESKQMATGYLNKTFLRPESGRVYTEAEVRKLIEQFMEDARTGHAVAKAGQSAFMRFTGWWGRGRKRSEFVMGQDNDGFSLRG